MIQIKFLSLQRGDAVWDEDGWERGMASHLTKLQKCKIMNPIPFPAFTGYHCGPRTRRPMPFHSTSAQLNIYDVPFKSTTTRRIDCWCYIIFIASKKCGYCNIRIRGGLQHCQKCFLVTGCVLWLRALDQKSGRKSFCIIISDFVMKQKCGICKCFILESGTPVPNFIMTYNETI